MSNPNSRDELKLKDAPLWRKQVAQRRAAAKRAKQARKRSRKS